MDDVERKLDQLRPRLEEEWTPERRVSVRDRAIRSGKRAERLHSVLRAGGTATALGLVAIVAWQWSLPIAHKQVTEQLRKPPPGIPRQDIELPDGSRAQLLTPATALSVLGSGQSTKVSLTAGAARFRVVPVKDPTRPFQITAGDATIEVLGTVFTVEHRQAEVLVMVEEGHVRLRCRRDNVTDLRAGDTGVCAAPLEAQEAPHVPAPPSRAQATHKDWRDLARARKYELAYQSLRQDAQPLPSISDAEGLLLAADTARLSGHPREALSPLLRYLNRFSKDARAPSVAMILGRVYFDALNNPAAAAKAFARAELLDPSGPLAEDAVARQVESFAALKRIDLARQALARYEAQFPGGRYRTMLRALVAP